ncbi:MAG: DUF11 domain-containing protein [Chloroflexi bacterium]|nr:DUF11 domain-containing protein [Chloroflexota bacterium]
MITFEGVVFLDAGAGSYPTGPFIIGAGGIQDPAWINQDIFDAHNNQVGYNQRLALYFAARNISTTQAGCGAVGQVVTLSQLQISDRDTGLTQIWNNTGTNELNIVWPDVANPGVINPDEIAWGVMFFDADQVAATGLIRFQLQWTMESCTPGPVGVGSCAAAVGPIVSAPQDADGVAVRVVGPRASLAFIEPNATTGTANPDSLVTYILQVSPPQLPTTTSDIVAAVGDPATLPDCGAGTFTDGNPFGWYDGPDPLVNTLIDNTALTPPITSAAGNSYYCYFQVEMDSALADPVTGEFVLEGDVVLTDVNGYSINYHVVAPPVIIRVPDVTVTKSIITPANPNQGVSIGDTVTYQITIRNTGQIPLRQITAIDSLTGPLAIPPSLTLAADTDGPGPEIAGEFTLTASYVVRVNDPSTLVNTVTVTAYLNLPGVNQTVSDSAVASIRVISDDLQLTLRLETVNGTAYDPVTNPPQAGSVLVFTTQYDNRGTVNLHDLQYVANYPTYVNAPAPTYVNSVIGAGQILPGIYGDAPSESASRFTYTVPASFPPDPIFERVRVRAFRPNNTAVFAEALLVLDLVNPNVSITAIRYRPGSGPAVTDDEAALRGDTLYFSGTITNESAQDLCGIEIRQYVRNPITGSLTPGNPYVIPAANILWPNGQPVGSLAPTGDAQNRDEADFTGVTYLVNASSPDPLDIVFEVYAPQQGPTCTPLADPLVDRTTVSVDISDIQVSSFIQARRTSDNAIVSYGLYPPPDLTYRFTYVATNVGGVQFTATQLTYCVTGYTPTTCGSQFPNDTINFLDPTPPTIFTPFQTRSDYFDLPFLGANAAGYTNPLQIEVVLQGLDGENHNVVIRTLLQFPIISSELPGTLTGPLNDRVLPADTAQNLQSSLVRGDADVPFQFSFRNETNTVLENVYVVNLLETSASPDPAFHQVGAFGFNSYYELCTVTGLSTGGAFSALGPNTLQPNESIFGTCFFTYGPSQPSGDFQMQVLAVGNRTIDPPTNMLISVVTWGIHEVPHLRVSKTGPGSAVATQPIDYTVSIYNQSLFQYVDFNPASAFTDVITPALDPSTLQPGGFNISNFSGLSVNGPSYRLGVTATPAVGTYQRVPPGGQFPDVAYHNDVTIQGTSQSGLIVTGTGSADVVITCPLTMSGFYDAIPGDPYADTDLQFTLGERARFVFFINNISNVPVTLLTFQDEMFNRENGLAATANAYPTYPGSPTFIWSDVAQPGVIPSDDYAVFIYDVILRPEDYPDPIDPTRITFNSHVTIANPPPNCAAFDIMWYFDSPNPVSIDKTVTPELVFPGNTATYDIQIANVSEWSDMQVVQVVDDLISQSPLVMDFTSASPNGPSGQLNELGPVLANDDNSAVLVQNGQQNYVVRPTDPPTLTNHATVYYYPVNGPTALATTVNPGPFVPMPIGPSNTLQNTAQASIGTASPLSCIMLPSQTDVPAGGIVDILVTLYNGSNDYYVNNVQFTVAAENGDVILTETSPGVPSPLNLTVPDNRQVSYNVQYIVPAGWSNPTLTITCTARGFFELTQAVLPDATSSIRLNVDAPELLLEMVTFGDAACPRIDGADADTLLDDPDPAFLLPDLVPPGTPDGVPEASVSDTIYYGILIQNNSLGLLFRNLTIDQADLNNGVSLTAAISAALTTALPSHQLAPGEQVTLCVPYQIVDQLADPLVHTLQLAAESVPNAPPNTPANQFTLQAVAAVDVQDSNIRIFKTASPTVSFPGDSIQYTLYIQNLSSQFGLLLDDVWDSLLGGPLTNASYCGNTNTPAINIPPASFAVCDQALTSIRFDDVVTGIDPYGWSWPGTPGVLGPNESATYTYLYTVQQIDPNPLINNAGVRAVQYNFNGNAAVPGNWTVQQDNGTPPQPITPTDSTFASVAITDSQLLVIKDGPATAPAGSNVTYTVTVVNIGDVDVANVRVRDEEYNLDRGLPPGTVMPMTECFFQNPNQSVTLAANVGTLVCQYTMTMPTATEIAANPTLDPFVNTAFADGQISNGGTLVNLPVPGSDTAIVDILVPGLLIDKIPSVGRAAIGDTVTYHVLVTNIGDVPISLDGIVDVPASANPSFPITTVWQNAAAQGAAICGTGTQLTVATHPVLQPGDTVCGSATIVIPNPAPANEYVNTVRINATSDPGGPNETPLVDSTSAIVAVTNLGVTVEKQAYDCDPLVCASPQIITTINEGVTYYYGITVTNTGDSPLETVEWRDSLFNNNQWNQVDNGFPDSTETPPTPTVNDSGTLDPGETAIVATYPWLPDYSRDGASLINRVDVRGQEATTNNFTPIRSDTAQVFILPTALQITKRACVDVNGIQPASFNPCPVNTPTAVRPGGTIWYEVTVTNPSNVTVTSVVVADTLQGTWAAAPNTLGPGQSATWVYQGAPVSAALTNVVNTATITATSNNFQISRSTTATVPVALGELAVQIVEDNGLSTAQIGTVLNFTVTVQNLSTTQMIANINVAVPFYSPNNLNALPFDLNPGETAPLFHFTYTVTPADSTMTFAAIAQGILQGNTITAQSSWTVIRSTNGLSVTKTVDRNFAAVGDTVNYTITITNDTGVTITGINVTDPLLQGLPAWTSPAWPATLAAGQSETHTIPYMVTAPILSNPILNTVTVTATVNGTVTTVQAGPVAVSIPDGNLLVINTPSTTNAVVGDAVTFAYRICNLADGIPPNDQDITSITLVDNLGALSLPFDFSLAPGTCYDTARIGVPMLASDVPVYTMSVTGTGTQFIGGVPTVLSQTVSRDVNVRQPGQVLTFTVTGTPNPVIDGTTVSVQYDFVLTNIGTTNLTIQSIQDNSPVPLCVSGYSPTPVNAVLTPGQVLSFVCTYVLPATPPDPIDGVWTVTTTTNETVTANLSIPVVSSAGVQVVIDQVTANPTIGVPGGQVTYTYRVRNISAATVLDVRLAHDPATDVNCTWTALNDTTDPLWLGTATLAVAGQLTAQATCDIPGTATPGSTATHIIEVYIGAAPTASDAATVNTLIQSPLTVDTLTSALVSVPGTPITAWRTGNYPVNISFVMTNTSNTLAITGVVPQLTIDGVACPTALTFNPAFNGTLNPNATVTVTCANYLYTPSVPPATLAVVVASATGVVQAVQVSDSATTDFTIYDLGFTVTLVADPTTPDVGATVNFTLTLTNTGASPLYLPPASANPVTSGCSSTTNSNQCPANVLGDFYAALNTVCFSGGALAPNTSCTLAYNNAALTNSQLTYIIGQNDPSPLTFTVGITLWSNTPAPAAYEITNQGTAVVTISRPAINAYNLSANPNPAILGNTITFTANIQNSGTQDLNALTATLTLLQTAFSDVPNASDGIVLTGGHAQGTGPLTMIINDADGILHPGDVAVATATWTTTSVGTFQVTMRATGNAGTGATVVTATDNEVISVRVNLTTTGTTTPGAGTATATVPATDPDGNPLDPNALDPDVTKTVTPETALPGQDVTFTVTITNGSTVAMANITVTDNMPTELTINNATASVGASVVSGQLITVTTGQLNPGERITVVIIARVNDDVSVPSLITNDACAAVTGRTQVCATVELPIGAGADALPTTGQGEPDSTDLNIATQGVAGVAGRPFGVAPLLMFGLLALLSTGQINRQRWLLGGLAVLIIAIIAGALVLVGSGDNKTDTKGTPQVVLPPGITATASPTLDRAPTLTPLPTGGPLESPVAPTALSAPPTLRPSPTPYIPPTPSGDRLIDIPKLNFTNPVPIVELPYSDSAWDVSNLGHSVGWLEKTTWMAPTWGNTVLVAHVQLANDDPGPFKHLNELEVGDDIFVYDGPYKYAFRVTEITEVNATAVEVTHPSVDPMLTLLTCTNWDFARGVYADRLVIRAEPVIKVN